MQLLYYLLVYIVGLVFGSFLNVVSDRIVNGESILFGRSKCDGCKKTLKAKDLVPILSFISVRGKCRYCKSKLSYYYPLSEMITGFIFVAVSIYTRVFEIPSPKTIMQFLFLFVIACFYIALFLTDAKYRLIPSKIIYSAIAFVIVFFVIRTLVDYISVRNILANDPFGKYMLKAGYAEVQLWYEVKDLVLSLAGAVGISAFFLFLIKITRGRGMGGGDVTLGFLIGLVNGFPNGFLAIFTGFVLGAVYSVVLISLGKKSMKDTIPFGPFLILGSVITYTFGVQILRWYFKLF